MNKQTFQLKQYYSKIPNINLLENHLDKIIDIYSNSVNINLYISYYKDKHELRSQELDISLKLNCKNKLFNKIIIINETEVPINFIDNLDDRIIIINNKKRQTYYDFFKLSNIYSDEDTINILCNSDIVIGENFDKINLEKDEVYLLERYEIDNLFNKYILNFNGSDTWIWKGLFDSSLDIGKYYMGIPYCDFKLAAEFYKNKYKLKNPSIDLKTYHLHLSGARNFTENDKVKSDTYIKLKQSKLDSKFDENDYISIK
jgi:hypothetical protein